MPQKATAKKRYSTKKRGETKKVSSKRKKYLVFISHSFKDSFIVRLLDKYIQDRGRKYGVEIYLAVKDIPGGDPIADEIKIKIQECNELLVLVTKYSAASSWVISETGAAWGLGKRIVAIVDKITQEEMPEIVAPFKSIDINNFDAYMEQLLGRAKGAK